MPQLQPSTSRVSWLGPLLLIVAVVARMAWTLFTSNGMNLVDLHVYVDGSAALLRGDLYDFTYSEVTPDFPLPFTYPPFAAMVFFPLHFLPFGLVGVAWQLLTVAALFWVVRISFELLFADIPSAAGADIDTHDAHYWRNVAMIWTAVGMWTEPVRTTLDYGQVNVFLVLGAMIAVRSTRWWWSGFLVGVVAGIKLTPAITGLYFAARRRWATAVMSAAVFGGTVGLSYLVIGPEAHEYFGTLLGDADRIGPVGSVWNQSLRGAISRVLGHDVQSGPLWIAGVLVFAVLAVFAWRALSSHDRLGTLVIVQLLGLLISPISWSHHWVWLVPMLIWLVHGAHRHHRGTKIVAGYWLVTMLIGVPWVLSFFQDSIWLISRPGLLAWLGTTYVFGALAFYLWVIYLGRITSRPTADRLPEPALDRGR